MTKHKIETSSFSRPRYRTATLVPITLLLLVPTGVLIGWIIGNPYLKSIIPGYTTMNPVTATLFLAVGSALLLFATGQRYAQRVSRIAAYLCLSVSALMLIKYVFGFDSHIDQVLFTGQLEGRRMAPQTAVCFLLTGLMLVLQRGNKPRKQRAILVLLSLSAFIGTLSLVGYFYRLNQLFGIAQLTPMALHTAVCFLLVTITVALLLIGERSIYVSRKILLTLFLSLAVITGISYVAQQVFQQAHADQIRLDALHTTADTINELGLALVDSETGQRGYLLTGRSHYLTPYEEAKTKVTVLSEKLQNELTPLGLSNGPAAKAITENVGMKLTELDRTIQLKQAGNSAGALAIVATDEGKRYMDTIRMNLASLDQTIATKTEATKLSTTKAEQNAIWTLALGATANILLIVAAFVFIQQSIREREIAKRAALQNLEELRARKSQDEALLSSIGDGVFAIDSTGKVILFNEAAAEISGFTAKEVIGKPYDSMLQFYHETTHKKADEFIVTALGGTKAAMTNHTILMSKKGHKISVADSAAPILDAHGNISGVIVVFRDVTHEVAVERLKEEQTQRLRTITEALPLGVFIARIPDGKVELINPMGTELLGRGIDPDATASNYTKVYETVREDGSTYPVEELPLMRTMRSGKPTSATDILVKQPSGKLIPLKVMAVPIPDAKGKLTSAMVVFEDITKERALEKAQDEFVSLTSHQLRTPLTAIRLFVELLANPASGKLNAKQADYVDKVEASTKRMISLVGDILNVTRVQLGQLKIEPVPTDIEQLVADHISELEPVAASRNTKLSFTKPDYTPGEVNIDPTLLGQVVHNFISNALRYSEPGKGVIEVTLQKTEHGHRLAVTDNGIGIPQEAQAKIFQRFFRAENAVKAEGEGTGLGLYLVKMIMENSGGSVGFSSKAGGPTTFYATIPLKGMTPHKGTKTIT